VVVIGGGFGGLTAVQSLRKAAVEITLIDRTNHHLFQPLLYQVATAALSPADIASPLRGILRGQHNVHVIMDEALGIDPARREVLLPKQQLPFDYLIVAPGSRHSYFGKDDWEQYAPGLKTLADAVHIRERLLVSFERAERLVGTPDAKPYLTFAIVGGGPTGVELAGAIAEIACKTILPDFHALCAGDLTFLLLEGDDRILGGFHPSLSSAAGRVLTSMGVEILLNTRVTEVTERGIVANGHFIETMNVIWAAGNEASPLLRSLSVPRDRQGRVIVEKDLSIPGDSGIFVIGDAAHAVGPDGDPLPGLAPVAMQQARYVARLIGRAIPVAERPAFIYKDRGKLATVGKARAVMEFGRLRFSGVLAWVLWAVVHIFFLIGFRNRVRVMSEWIWYYLTYQPGARLVYWTVQDSKQRK
jgi:NADH:quinone reductase (non-electrogenic)